MDLFKRKARPYLIEKKKKIEDFWLNFTGGPVGIIVCFILITDSILEDNTFTRLVRESVRRVYPESDITPAVFKRIVPSVISMVSKNFNKKKSILKKINRMNTCLTFQQMISWISMPCWLIHPKRYVN